jgi:hypothetical protein
VVLDYVNITVRFFGCPRTIPGYKMSWGYPVKMSWGHFYPQDIF